jgi:histidyl-tRNA synthetase
MIQSLRGMNDLFDEDSQRFTYLIETASNIAKRYGFTFLSTPILEETALFKRSVGESSDIVGKEMYQFEDKGQNDVCLRPEGTAGVVRALIQKKLDKAGGEQRYFYYGPMFRYERPQKGRLRQFHQFGAESFGNASVLEDTAIILMMRDIFDALQIPFKLIINSLGCKECMPPYKESLVNFVSAKKAEICEDCVRRLDLNPIRVLDCKNEHCQSLYSEAPKLLQNLCGECDSDFTRLKKLLDDAGMSYEIDTNLVRGLDYYSKTAFEFVADGIGAQNAIAGGGRYDRLVEFLDGKPTPAVGFAIGIERVMGLLTLPEIKQEGYYFGSVDEEGIDELFTLAQKKRKATKAHISYDKRAFKKHLNAAEKINARFCVIIGENERKAGQVWVKDFINKSEETLDVATFLKD